MTTVLTMESTSTLANLIWRSGKYPVLVNEGIIAMSLLCTHEAGGALVLEALMMPFNGKSAVDGVSPASTVNANNSFLTPSSRNDGLPVPEHALDMLVNVLRNVDNPVNFPIEVRVNTCTFLLQLQRYVSSDSLAPIRGIVLPVVRQVAEDSQEVEQEEKLAKVANLLVTSWTIPSPST